MRLTWVLCAVVVELVITVTIGYIDAVTVKKVGIAYAITDGTITNVAILVGAVFDNDDHWTQTLKNCNCCDVCYHGNLIAVV